MAFRAHRYRGQRTDNTIQGGGDDIDDDDDFKSRRGINNNNNNQDIEEIVEVDDFNDGDDDDAMLSTTTTSSSSKTKDSRRSRPTTNSDRTHKTRDGTTNGNSSNNVVSGGDNSQKRPSDFEQHDDLLLLKNFGPNSAEKSLQLRLELEEVLASIPEEFQRPDFSYIRVVAQALQSPKGVEAEKLQLEELFKILDEEVTRVVDEYYKGFNKSIRHFSDILTYLKGAQDNVSVLKKQVIKCMELLTSRSEDLATLYANSLHQSELQRLLKNVDEVKEGPLLVDEAISKKHHLHAVKLIEKYLRMFQWQIPKNIRALKEIQQELEDKQKLLPEIIIEDLHRHVYLRGGADKFQQTGLDDELLVSASESTPDATSTKNLLRLASFYRSGMPDEIVDDPDVNPELDSRCFMRLCIEALDKLDMLPHAHSVFLQRLKTEIGSIIDSQVTQFMELVDTTDAELARIMSMPESYRAVMQGHMLSSMLQQLCTKLIRVMRNMQYLIEIMNKKATQKTGKKGLSGNAGIPSKQGDTLDELIITRDALLKIRTKIMEELESVQYGDKQTDIIYFNSLEKLLAMLIQDGEKIVRQQPKSPKLRVIVDSFASLLKAELHYAAKQQQQQQQQERAQLQREQEKRHHRGFVSATESTSEVIEDLSHALFASTAEPRIEAWCSKLTDQFVALFAHNENQTTITIKYVWEKVQEEMVSVIRELLGINVEELMSMEKQRHTRKDEAHEPTAKAGTAPRPRFRFAINIEALSSHGRGPNLAPSPQTTVDSMSMARCSRLCPTFIFLPHNMMWIFKVVRHFVEQVASITGATTATSTAPPASDAPPTETTSIANTGTIGEMASIGFSNTSGRSSGDFTSLLNDINKFMDNVIQLILIPKLLLDYRSQINDLLKGKDAFRPRDHGEEYDEDDDSRPLLHSAYQLAVWMKELYQYSMAIPYSSEMLDIMEMLLRKYLDECREQFQRIMEGKVTAECMTEPRASDLTAMFEKDPSWELIRENSAIMHVHSSPAYLSKEEFEVSVHEKVDERITSRSQLDKAAVITDTSPLILLANLHDSLEWISEQILAICKVHKVAMRSRSANAPPSIASGSRGIPDSVSSMTSLDSDDSGSVASSITPSLPFAVSSPLLFSRHAIPPSGSVSSSGGSSALAAGAPASTAQQQQKTQFVSFAFEQHFNSFRALSNRCLWAIKIDLRARCFVHLEPIKMGDYNCQEETNEPESFVKNFNQDISHVDKCLTPYLPTYKLQYLFDGLGLLIANVLIAALANVKIRKFNAQGILKMRRNIFAIQQNITNIIASQEQHFNRARQYYDLLNLSEKQFFANVSEAHAFTHDEYKAILLTETPFRQINNNALVVLANMFQQFRQLPRPPASTKH